jgi:hypothetical protein
LGQIVGYYYAGRNGFLLDHGNYTPLDVPGSTFSLAYGINDSGQIVGSYAADPDGFGPFHGFLLDHGS